MNYKFVNQLNSQQIFELVDMYKNEFWSQQRTYNDVEQMLKASDIILGLVDNEDKLVGFTRVLTDFVYRATIYDVIIKPSQRNQGLGVKLMDAIVNHPQLNKVEHIALFCLPEMIPFYQRWGFTTDVGNLKLMYRYNHLHKDNTNDY